MSSKGLFGSNNSYSSPLHISREIKMVKEINKNQTVYFKCEECGLLYKDKVWAVKCQKYCKKYKSCNLEITKHAVKK